MTKQEIEEALAGRRGAERDLTIYDFAEEDRKDILAAMYAKWCRAK